MKHMSMDQMPLHTEGRILNIHMDSFMRKKLTDMGLVRGTPFKVSGQAPLGDPIEINLRGYNLTIRKKDAKNIEVEEI